jgi:hypothetical protein
MSPARIVTTTNIGRIDGPTVAVKSREKMADTKNVEKNLPLLLMSVMITIATPYGLIDGER